MRTRVRFTALALTSLTLAGCTQTTHETTPGPTSPSPTPAVTQVKIAFIQDLSPDGAAARTAPAFQGVKLALDTATVAGDLPVGIELVALDTDGSPESAATVARHVADDPSYVAAVGAPFLTGQVTIGRILDEAGVPMITLSGLGPDLSRNGWATWRRAVANQDEQGRALAAYADGLARSRRGVCLLGDGSAEAAGLLRTVAGSLAAHVVFRSVVAPQEDASGAAVAGVAHARCGVVIWGGFSSEGAVLRRQLVEAGLRGVVFLGGDGLKDGTYLSVAGGAGAGTVASCPCADLTPSTDLPAQRFIQDYQSDFGLPPGPYAAEAFDVARIFLQAIGDGADTRRGVLQFLEGMPPFEGLADVYAFQPDGELVSSSAEVRFYRDESGRWIAASPPPDASLDLVTPGSLTVVTCRVGRPFSYRRRGRWTGFDVDVSRAVSRHLGLRLAWAEAPCRAAVRDVRLGRSDTVLLSTGRLAGTSALEGSNVVLSLRQALVVDAAATPNLTKMSRLQKGDFVGVVRGSMGEGWAVHHVPVGVRLRRFDTAGRTFDALAAGALSAVIDEEPRSWVETEHRPSLAVVQSFDVGDHEVFGARRDDPGILAALNVALAHAVDSGAYARLFVRYFPGAEIPPETLSPP